MLGKILKSGPASTIQFSMGVIVEMPRANMLYGDSQRVGRGVRLDLGSIQIFELSGYTGYK